MYKNVEDLEIYQKAEELADKIWEEVINWDYFVKDTVGKQLVKAVDSVGANISEGEGRYHFKDTLNFIYMARGSLKETQYWLQRAKKRKLMETSRVDRFITMTNTLLKQLNAFITTKRKRIR